MSADAPTHPQPLYVRRTRDTTWCWCPTCPNYPLSVLDSNGLLATMTRPAHSDLCPECLRIDASQGV